MNKMFSKEVQKELHNEFRVLLKDVWGDDEHMIDFCAADADLLVKTKDGYMLQIKKPHIETRFCFGYSDSAYDTEDYDRANRMAHHARTNEDYFREQNLKDLRKKIEQAKSDAACWFGNAYFNQGNDVLKTIFSFRYSHIPSDINDTSKYQPVTKEDRVLIAEALEVELERFSKRVETYLKRYGLSKVHSWSYWRDE